MLNKLSSEKMYLLLVNEHPYKISLVHFLGLTSLQKKKENTNAMNIQV